MVELIPGRKYKITKLAPNELYYDLLHQIGVFSDSENGSCSFRFNGKYRTLEDGFEVEELPPPEAEAYTMPDIHEAAGFTTQTPLHNIPKNDGESFSVPGEIPRKFESGAIRDSNIGKPFVHDLLGYTRLRFGYHMAKNATRYGDGNFKKGIPTDVALESLDRHLAQYISGERDYDHLSAIFFNLQLVMMNEEKEGIKPDHYYGKS